MGTGYEEMIHFHKCIEDAGLSVPQSIFDPFNPFSYKTESERKDVQENRPLIGAV